jgi:hypothetical protein
LKKEQYIQLEISDKLAPKLNTPMIAYCTINYNNNILFVIYNYLISENESKRYAPYLANLDNNNKDAVIAQILSA